jgi:hypothetical protein
VGGLRPINNPSDSTAEDEVAALDLEVEAVGMRQEELQVDLSKASEVEVLTRGVVSNLAGHSS